MISAALAILESEEQRNELSEFYEENKSRLYSIALERLHNRQDAEDAIQEAFLRIVRYPEKFFEIPTHKRLPYAVIIIRNVIFDMFSYKSRSNFDELPEELPDERLSVEDIVIGEISGEELTGFLETLPETKLQAIILKSVYNLNCREIASVLNTSETAVRKRISDAYKLINDYLGKEEK